jgi:hypothetical protein
MLVFALGALGCERPAIDPPPPASRHEIPAAPPAALGAHLASNPTPAPLVERHSSSPEGNESDSEEDAVPGPDAGSEAGAHAVEPEGVAL